MNANEPHFVLVLAFAGVLVCGPEELMPMSLRFVSASMLTVSASVFAAGCSDSGATDTAASGDAGVDAAPQSPTDGGADASSPTTSDGGTGRDASDSGDASAPPPISCTTPYPAPTGSGVILQVDACAARHSISDDIYGITFFWDGSAKSQAGLQFAKDVHLPLNRIGGDARTRYNWKVDATNAGFDFYFMAGANTSSPAPGESSDALVTANQSVGAKTVMTVPIIDFITKSSASTCSYPKSLYPTQDKFNPYSPNCGNGQSGGQPIADTHIGDHDIANDPSIQSAWVQHLVQKFGSAAKGGVAIYEMDNEPTGWPGIHFDIHPKSPNCMELISKTQAYAAAVKAADSSALVLGPGDIAPADVFSCMGSTNGEQYLAAMAAYEKNHGVRILDYYSMHYPGCCSGDQIAQATAHIKTHKGWIAANYPGTKLGYDEYNWGDAASFDNALLEADGLGLFGSTGVDLASFWGLDDVTTPTATAFRLYRDFDGKGGAFGDVSIGATSSDASQLRVYAAQRASDSAVTIVVVNRSASDVASVLAVSNHTPHGSAASYVLTSSSPGKLVAGPPPNMTNPGHVDMTFAAHSATLVVVP